MLNLKQIDANQLSEWERSHQDFILLDIRESFELKQYRHQNVLHLPFSEIMDNIDKIPIAKPIVVACHLGERSALLVNYLSRKHKTMELYNLKGGLAPFYPILSE